MCPKIYVFIGSDLCLELSRHTCLQINWYAREVHFTRFVIGINFDSDIPADIDEMLAISAAVAVSIVAEASTGPGLIAVDLANGVICPTPTAFRASVTAIVTTLAKSKTFTGLTCLLRCWNLGQVTQGTRGWRRSFCDLGSWPALLSSWFTLRRHDLNKPHNIIDQ